MAQVRQDKVQIQVEIDGKPVQNTIGDLQKSYRQLNREIRDLTPGTELFNKKAQELGKVRGYLNDARDAANAYGKQQTKLQGLMGKFGSVVKSAFAPLLAISAGGAFARLASEYKEQATQLQQLEIRFETVFGEAASIVEDSAERQAKALGLSIEQYKQAAVSAGDLLIPMGFQREEAAALSTDLVGLSGALSEWTGGQTTSTEVSEILTKALLGEREQLKGLGISISEADVQQRLAIKGQKEFTGQALEQAKALATLELVTEKSADAQEAFANNTGSLARQQAQLNATIQNVKDSIAKALIPAFSSALGWVNDLIGASGSLSEQYEEERVEINVLVTRIGRLNEGNEDRVKLINELNAKYPSFLGNLKAENVSNQQLRDRLKEVNAQYINKIILQQEEEKIQEQAQQAAQKARDATVAEIELDKRLVELQGEYNLQVEDGISIEEKYGAIRKELLKSEEGSSIGRKASLLSLASAYAEYSKSLNRAGDEEEFLIELQEKRDEIAKRLGTTLGELNAEQGGEIDADPIVPQDDGELSASEKTRLAKEAQKRREEREKLERDLAKYIEDLQLELQEDSLEKRIALINLQADREIAALKGNADQVAEATALLNKKRDADIAAAEAAAQEQAAAKKLSEQEQDQQDQLQALENYHAQRQAEIVKQVLAEAEAGAFASKEDAEAAIQERMLAQLKSYLQARIDLLKQFGEDASALEAELAELKIDEILAPTEGGAAGGGGEGELPEWYERLVAGMEAARQVIGEYYQFVAQQAQQQYDEETAALEKAKAKELNLAANSAKKREEIELKYQQKKDQIDEEFRKKEKARAITQSIIDTALMVTKALGTPPAPNVPAGILAGVLGGIQTSVIAAQSYAEGGFTGEGFGQPDASGFKPAGIVHEGEYVNPKWQVESPKYRPLIEYLNQGRLRGYAGGGFVSPVTPNNDAISAVGRQTNDVLREEIAGLRQDLGRIQFVMPVDEAVVDLMSRKQVDLSARRSQTQL